MRIVICGASGFVGSALSAHLRLAGHHVIAAGRHPGPDGIRIDFTRPEPAAWREALGGCDAVINCVGIFIESPGQGFADLHTHGPQQLFAACMAARVGRIVQISAAGESSAPYMTSKRAADRHLQSLPMPSLIVRPSLIYGEHGTSARCFRLLASLPFLPLPAGGRQALQSIHIDDLCAAIVALLAEAGPERHVVNLVGQGQIRFVDLLATYRKAMGFAPACQRSLPAWLMRALAGLGGKISGSLLTPDSWRMLQTPQACIADDSAALLGRAPRPPSDFIPPDAAPALRQAALATWRRPLLRWVLAAVWLITAALSFGIYPQADSLALLARVGLHGTWAHAALICAALLDLVLGVLTLCRPGRRLWLTQIAVIVGYSAIVAACLPEFLSHPFGPIVKNLPILALLVLLYAEETQA